MRDLINRNPIPVTVYIYKTDVAVTPGRQHELGEMLLDHALADAGFSQYEKIRTKKGKPLVYASSHGADPTGRGPEICHVSLSHTPGYVVCALCIDRPVGIDIEIIGGHRISATQMRRTEKKLLKQAFEPEFDAALAAADERALRDRTARFYERWTLAEAFGKMKGVGLAFSEGYDEIIACPHETWHMENTIITVLAGGSGQERLETDRKEVSI
ncbi:MAG: 4'-phosphopantetheinyl transferase superfamily protein [Lachnospiraceae bacterium]|nr:4'-phosphopantetheinyl transferase superfamily protein [Lachnospiraceae bacterium]